MDWFENVIGRILNAEDHQKKVNFIRKHIEALQKQLDIWRLS